METTIDKIEIKYILGSYKDSVNYPEPCDIIYLMVKRAMDKGEDLNDVTFTTTKLFKKLGECKKSNVDKSIKSLIDNGQIELIREGKESSTYRILKNPYL